MLADLHSHFPMHLVPGTPADALCTAAGRARLRDRLRARLVALASRVANYRSWDSGPRVTVPQLQAGGVRVVLSVAYSFFDELDLDQPYGAPPERGYLERLERQLDLVEAELATEHGGVARVVRSPAELDAALATGELAFVHCVEGGFHLGPTPEDVERAVARLAARGVAYVTLAHLVFRGVATNVNAFPFLPDAVARRLLPQPRAGLTELGRAAVRAMARERVLVDLAHMTPRAITETLDLLDAEGADTPVLVSHGTARLGRQEYGLDDATLRRVAERDGVVGLILAQHQLNDGVRRRRTTTLDESFPVIAAHLERIAAATGSHRHAAIGSDLDGFIKPTAGGIESAADLAALEARLRDRFGAGDADAIAHGNALRVLRAGWGGAAP